MRPQAKLVHSKGKWWCFSGFWVGTAITPVLAWEAAEKSRNAFNTCMGFLAVKRREHE